jgi:hypothetical protein
VDANEVFLIAGLTVAAIFAVGTPLYICSMKDDHRVHRDYINDVRAMNRYNSYFVGAIVIFFGLFFNRTAAALPNTGVVLLLLGFLSGALSLFFFPFKMPPETEASVGHIRGYWIFKVVASQCTVIFTALGITNAVVHKIWG